MLFLVKINDSEYIDDMYEKEYLYFKSLKDFRSTANDNSGRLDPRELNLKNEQLSTLTIKFDSNEISLHDQEEFSVQFMEFLSDSNINCCSLHWVEIEPEQPSLTFQKKVLRMGDKALLIYNWKRFFDILDTSIDEMGFEYSRRKVTYYNPKEFSGDLSLHHKDEAYKWQSEYRILIAPTENAPICIPLPGLRKISCVINTKNLENLRIITSN